MRASANLLSISSSSNNKKLIKTVLLNEDLELRVSKL
jgi:hypothetical protein